MTREPAEKLSLEMITKYQNRHEAHRTQCDGLLHIQHLLANNQSGIIISEQKDWSCVGSKSDRNRILMSSLK